VVGGVEGGDGEREGKLGGKKIWEEIFFWEQINHYVLLTLVFNFFFK